MDYTERVSDLQNIAIFPALGKIAMSFISLHISLLLRDLSISQGQFSIVIPYGLIQLISVKPISNWLKQYTHINKKPKTSEDQPSGLSNAT